MAKYVDHRLNMNERALVVVMQFLKDSGFEQTLEALEAESKKSIDENPCGQPNVLISALTVYDEHLTAQKKDSTADDVEEALRKKQEDKEVHVTDLKSTLTPHQQNVIAVRFSPAKDSTLLATASADKTVRITDWKDQKLVSTIDQVFQAPVIAIDFNPKHPNLLLASCMNGTHFVLDHTKTSNPVVQAFKDHNKYVISCKWAPDGRSFATASWDKALRIYSPVDEKSDKWHQVKDIAYPAEIGAIEWIHPTNKLLVSVREDNYLHEIDLKTLKETNKFNMNAKTWDDHVSFAVLDLTASTDGIYVLACTDKDRVIMFHAATGKQVRNFYGASNGSYSNPRSSFSHSGKYVYCTTEDRKVVVWETLSEKLLHKLEGHLLTVRDLHHHPTLDMLATGSFDKSVKLWHAL